MNKCTMEIKVVEISFPRLAPTENKFLEKQHEEEAGKGGLKLQ